MKNTKRVLIIASVTIFIIFGTLVPIRSTCGCITQERFILASLNQVKTTINLYHDEHDSYPSLEILNTQLSSKIIGKIVARMPDIDRQGVFYSTGDDGMTYKLSAYAKRETLFGVTRLVKVFDETMK